MLSEKETNKVTLSAVRKTNARVIMLKKPGDSKDKKKEVTKKDSKNLLPPLNQFNTGYIKAKDNDPL